MIAEANKFAHMGQSQSMLRVYAILIKEESVTAIKLSSTGSARSQAPVYCRPLQQSAHGLLPLQKLKKAALQLKHQLAWAYIFVDYY
jgi:hypothetical protein